MSVTAPARAAAPASPATAPTFTELGVPAPLVAVLASDGKVTAFPIQADTFADAAAGRDVLGRGKTGSGKTLAFSLPMAARLGGPASGGRDSGGRDSGAGRSGAPLSGAPRTPRRPGHPRGLILAPTRELVTQIETVLKPLASAYGLTTTTIFGGVKQTRQVAALKAGVDIVVACPGRLEDLMHQGFVSLDAVEITVLDEADHMADLGFLKVVTRILEKTPRGGQRLLFSATLDNGIDVLVRRFLSDPVMHSVDEATSPVAAMTHHVFETTAEDKEELIRMLASGMGKRILFTRTKHHAKKLAKKLIAAGIPAVDLHGNLSQNKRDANLAAFADDSVRVLVATDVAARGVDIDDVELVVHVDPPMEHKAYLHRSGRTARAGRAGEVVTVCLPDQRRDLAQLLRKAKITVTPVRVTAASPVVVNLVGEVAPFVKPAPPASTTQAPTGRSQGANARRKRAAREARGNGSAREGRDTSGGRDARPARDSERRQRNGRSDAQSPHPRSDRAAQGGRQDRAARPARARSGADRQGRAPQRRVTTHA